MRALSYIRRESCEGILALAEPSLGLGPPARRLQVHGGPGELDDLADLLGGGVLEVLRHLPEVGRGRLLAQHLVVLQNICHTRDFFLIYQMK